MAMGGKNNLIRARHPLKQHFDNIPAFGRGGIANRIRNIYGGCPGLNGDFDHPAQVIILGAGRIHRRPLHVVTQVAGEADGVMNHIRHFVHIHAGNGTMRGRRADECMDTRQIGVFHRLPGPLDIAGFGAGKPADHSALGAFGDLAHGCEISLGGDRKAGFDNIHPHIIQHFGNFELFIMGHGCARALLAIAQGGVKNQHTGFVSGHVAHLVSP